MSPLRINSYSLPNARVATHTHTHTHTHTRYEMCIQQQVAQQVLTQFREHPEAWTRVDSILELSHNQEAKVSTITSFPPCDLQVSHVYIHTCQFSYACILYCNKISSMRSYWNML